MNLHEMLGLWQTEMFPNGEFEYELDYITGFTWMEPEMTNRKI